jgi:hypothetical protein
LGQFLLTAALGPLVMIASGQPAVAGTTDCDTHYAKAGANDEFNSSLEFVQKAGMAIGGHGSGGDGFWIGQNNAISCIRVASITMWHDGDNYIELGATLDVTGTGICNVPDDNDWYRFVLLKSGGTRFCPGQNFHQGAEHFHKIDIYRDASVIRDWHIEWDGAWLYTTLPITSSGVPSFSTERWNTTDSAFGDFDGLMLMKANRNWEEWADVSPNPYFQTLPVDPEYIIHVVNNHDPKRAKVCLAC